MFCARCGMQNSGDAKFCGSCGDRLNVSFSAAQDIPAADLPDVSRSRLLAALKRVPPETFVVNESRVGWAALTLIAAVLGLGFVLSQANRYKWQSDDRLTNLSVVIVCFAIGWISAAYLIRWARSEFKAYALLNALYFIRFRFDRIEVVSLSSAGVWDAKHFSDSRGAYTGTRFYFRAGGKQRILKVKSLRSANEIILALKRFPGLVTSLIQNKDSSALYALDLLYEWRRREETFPRAINSPSGIKYVLGRLGPTILAAFIGAMVFLFVIAPYNDSCDDELRWHTATTAATATAYRLYLATRPEGRHSSGAHAALDILYDKAAEQYKTSAGLEGSQGIEAVIRILEYAKATGRYKVFVNFSGDNEIPNDVDVRLRSISGFARLAPVLPSFTESMNRAREARILERISASFGKVIPGDVLQFTEGQATVRDPVFRVDYVIKASGALYYPEKQEHEPEANRDWYTGISFGWKFKIAVPETNASTFQFSLDSKPADLFNVAYERSGTAATEFSSGEVYGAMADSAFDNFGSKLLSELSVN
jgi:hypothetical protein